MRAVKIEKKGRGSNPKGFRWEFFDYNPQKKRNDRVPIGQIPLHIQNSQDESVVYEYVKLQNAKNDAAKYRAEQRVAWKMKYHNFKEYLSLFETYQKSNAPNSYRNDVYYLECYVFAFFLENSSLNNLNEWYLLNENFLQWLKDTKPLKYAKECLTKNTQNNIVKAYNCFLVFASRKGWLDVLKKCPTPYDRESTESVNSDDIFQEDEIPKIYEMLKSIRSESAEIFMVEVYTGMRINECLGLSIKFVTSGKIQGDKSIKIHRLLENYNLGNYYGFICLESQPALKSIRLKGDEFKDRFGVLWSKGQVPRKPLKMRKKVDPKFFRYIPIFNKTAWNVLVDSFNRANEQYTKKPYGSDMNNYLLFDGITASMYYRDLTKALERLKMRHRSPHKTRHTFFTWFYGTVGEDMTLAGFVGGHKDIRDVNRYCHLKEQIGREREQQIMVGKKLERVA